MPFKTRWNWKEEVQLLTELSASGMTMAEIAEKYEVSKQRIKQVFDKFNIPHIGLKKKAKEAAEKWNLKWGDKQDTDLYQAQREKFRRKKSSPSKVAFTIKFGEIDWPKFCPVLGIELDYFAESRQENSVSFDRIDPAKGYVAGNVKIISWRANRIKNDGTAEEHRRIADYIAANE